MIVAQGEEIPQAIVAPLRDSAALREDAAALRQRFLEDGYLYLSAFFPADDIAAARHQVFSRLADMDEIAQPVDAGIFTGRSERTNRAPDRGAFWRSVSESWNLRRLSHGIELHGLMDQVLGMPSRVQDYIFLRPAGPGKHTNVHCDYPFFTRSTEDVATAWIALGPVPLRTGPLFILENSHQWHDISAGVRGFDISRDSSRTASMAETPQQLATARGTRILTNDFGPGDVVVFGMFLLHGALDNISENNEVRLSCDVRYQDRGAPLDPRYFGPNPTGTTGASYGELVGAKAMTEDWHQR